jgi:DNA-binding transcriptional MerR regulator
MSNHGERTTTERPYLSIGEVLGLLLDEFPDVTISKIRFLESQGLIEPERTPSGYRKFYDADVERLRFILREQRENYLPLKVIRDRLDGETPTGGVPRPEEPTGVLVRPALDHTDPTARTELPSDAAVRSHPAGATPLPGADLVPETPDPQPPAPPEVEVIAIVETTVVDTTVVEATVVAAPVEPDPIPGAAVAATALPAVPRAAAGAGQFSRAELLTAAGIDAKLLDDLESFGLVTPRSIGQQLVYDATARQVCELASSFARLGIDARHLRGWKTSAEREASLFEQRILPLLRQRNPHARDQSTEILDELAGLGAGLRHVLVTQALQQYLS